MDNTTITVNGSMQQGLFPQKWTKNIKDSSPAYTNTSLEFTDGTLINLNVDVPAMNVKTLIANQSNDDFNLKTCDVKSYGTHIPTKFAENCFAGCKSLLSVSAYQVSDIAATSFKDCTKLSSVVVNDSFSVDKMTNLVNDGGFDSTFNVNEPHNVYYVETHYDKIFAIYKYNNKDIEFSYVLPSTGHTIPGTTIFEWKVDNSRYVGGGEYQPDSIYSNMDLQIFGEYHSLELGTPIWFDFDFDQHCFKISLDGNNWDNVFNNNASSIKQNFSGVSGFGSGHYINLKFVNGKITDVIAYESV